MKTMQESWAWLAEWVEGLPSQNANWTPFSAFVLPLLRACMRAGIDRHFRAGQSMTHIIISTSEMHGLEKFVPSPPRVTLRYVKEKEQWFIAWSHWNLLTGPEPEREDYVTFENVLHILKMYLADLWLETQEGKHFPAAWEKLGSAE
jgi:hypothetical protein